MVEGGWLVGNGEPEWHAPVTAIAANGIDTVRVSGDLFGIRIHWLENGCAVDDMTGATPNGLTRQDAVRS
jgi:hypothetical protein